MAFLASFKRACPRVAHAWILASLVALPAVAFANPNAVARFRNLDLESGLSQSSVTCMLQDSRGFLWLGTWDGLNRYDGNGFTIFRADPDDSTTLSENGILCLAEDAAGDLWIGTEGGGFCRLDHVTDRFTRYRCDADSSVTAGATTINGIAVAGRGPIWLASERAGLLRFDPRTRRCEALRHDPADATSLADDTVNDVMIAADGAVWAATDAGLCRLAPGTTAFRRYVHADGDESSLIGDHVQCLAESPDGTLWAGTSEGLSRYEPSRDAFTGFRHDPEDPASCAGGTIVDLWAAADGALWVATSASGLDLLPAGRDTFHHFRRHAGMRGSLLSDDLLSVLVDATGVVWAGTVDGASLLDGEAKQFGLVRNLPGDVTSLSHNCVWRFAEAPDGRIWVATSEGLDLFDPATGANTVYRHDPADSTTLEQDDIAAMAVDRRGRLWVGGTKKFLNRFDPDTGVFHRFVADADDSTGLSSAYVTDICEDHRGRIWLATGDGLVTYDPDADAFQRVRIAAGELDVDGGAVYNIFEDSRHRLWLGTWREGLALYEPDSGRLRCFRNDPERLQSISSNVVMCVREDSRGRIWAGTSVGLNRLLDEAAGSFRRITTKDGLPNNFIYGVVEDARHRLWLSTNNGLCRYDPEIDSCDNYDSSDGLQSNEFNAGAYFRDRAGRLYFGGIGGFNWFVPQEIHNNPHVPRIAITDFRILNKPVGVGPDESGRTLLARPIAATTALVLSHHDTMLDFEFAALHFASPDRNQFAYFLEGFDSEWNEIGTRHHATYTSLPPGDYVLRVRAANNDGIWNEEGIALAITVTPPFWQKIWFLTLAVSLLAMLIYSAHLYRVGMWRRRSRIFEQRVRERTADLTRTNQQLQMEVVERERAERALLRAKDAAEAATRAKSQFLANMSHEIRTPMNGVIGMTSLLLDTELQTNQREYCDMLHTSASALLSLINDILDFSKIEAGKLELEDIRFDLREVVDSVAAVLAPIAAEKGLNLTCRVDHDVPDALRGDPGRLRQILMNLVGNAVKFTNEGNVRVRVSRRRSRRGGLRLRFAVTDTGKGIARENRERLFLPFTQEDASTTRKHGGTGLGLAISRQLAELMQGRIAVRSELGRGATFWFTAEFEAAADASSPAAPAAGRQRLLVVHDCVHNQAALREALLHVGRLPETAGTQRAALAALRRAAAAGAPFTAVIVGSARGTFDPLALAAAVRSEAAARGCRLLLLASLAEGHDPARLEGLDPVTLLKAPLTHAKLWDCLASLTWDCTAEASDPTRCKQGDLAAAPRPTRKPCVLLVEDNRVNQRVAQYYLDRLGYQVDVVPDGCEALAALKRKRYDAVLMDVQMPRMDGFEATRAIRDPRSGVLDPDVPVIAMTAHAMKNDRERCLASGMNDYLTKPVDAASLQEILAIQISRRPAPAAT
ncbi:MAG: response regulator [Candidatus Krumholzibacteriota bacterium]|nr:response regulator [Candidatus Krumholzibacteriota bacterium]